MNIKSIFSNKKEEEDILDNHPDAFIIINFQKEITFWNKRAEDIFGYSKREVLGQNVSFLLEGGIEAVYKALGSNKSAILRAKSIDGIDLYVEITVSDSTTKDEVFISARNVTQKHTLIEEVLNDYEKIKKISENKNGFIADMSHDLKTPAHSIVGFAQALLDGIGGELAEKQSKYISIIKRNADNLLLLLNSIIDISKLESDRMEFKFKTFDVTQVLNQVDQSVRSVIEDKRIMFDVDVTDIVKKNCYSDDNALRQVLMNILDNAIKFTDTGSIVLKVLHPDLDFVRYHGIKPCYGQTDKSYLLFSITDTGAGIFEDELNYIFDAYKKNDNTSKKHAGAGLGLAITQKLVEQLGGIIWVESEILQGSTFNFIIPIEKSKLD